MNKVLSIAMLKGIRYFSLIPLLSLTAMAQTTTWQQVQSGTYSWQDPLNWSTGVVPNGMSAVVSFGNNPLGAQTIGLDENVVFGTLSFGNSKGSYTLAASMADTLTLSNDGLGATISNLGTASNVISTILDLADGPNTFHIADGRLTLDGVVTGSNGFTKTGDGWLVLRRTNTFTGEATLQGGITLVAQAEDNNAVLGATGVSNGTIIMPGATLALVNDGSNASSSTTGSASVNTEAVTVAGAGYLNNGAIRSYAGREQNQLTGAVTVNGDTRFQSLAGTLAFTGTVNLGANNLRIGGNGFTSLSGAVQGTGTITHFGISGFRMQNTTASNSFSGAIISELGEVRAENSDTNGLTAYDNVSALTVKNGFLNIMAPTSGTFTVKSRLPDALPITLQAGRIRIESLSFNSTNGFAWAETVGAVTSTLGHTYFDFRDTNADSGTRVLTVSSLTRSSPSVTFQLGGDGAVATNIGNGTLGNRYRFFNTALDSGPNVPFVGGWAYLNKEFMKYNALGLGGNGYRALEAADYHIDQAEGTWDASKNIKITSANRTLSLNTSIQSLNILSTTGRTLGGSAGAILEVGSGGIITSDATHTISVPFLTAGAASDYHLYDIAWSSNIFRSVVADNGANPVSFVKAAGGTTSFLAANTYTGTTYINEGFFRDVIGARNTVALGSGNLTFAGSPINQATYETDRDFSRALGAGAGQVQFLSGSGVGFSAYGAPITVNFGGAGDPVVWGSTHFNPGLFTLNGGNATHVVTLVNPVDLGNEQRYIRLDGGASGGNRASFGVMAGDLYNGGIVKRGGGVLVFDNAKTYNQGTVINEGELWLRGQGTAGANVVGNDIQIGAASRLKLDGPWNIGSRQLVSMYNADDNSASAIAFGPGYGDGSGLRFHTFLSDANAAGQLGAYDFYIHNQQTTDNRRNRLAVQISGLHNFSVDVMNQIVNVAPDVEAWFGADTGNGTFTGASLPATGRTKTGGNTFFRLGSGGGTITLANANVLDGAFPLIVGAEDNTGRTNIGGLVYLPQAQNYSGTVTQTVGTALTAGNLIGAGGVLVVGNNGALNNGNNNISLRGGEIRFGINPNNSFLGGVDTQYALRNIHVKSANGVVRTIPITGGSNGILQLNELTMRMDDADRVLTIGTIGTHYTQTVFNGAVTLENGNTTARSAFFDVGNDNNFNSGLGLLVLNGVMSQTGTAAVSLQKRQGGVLVLKNDNTYAGTTNVQQGRLVIAHPGAAGNGGTTINMNTNNDRRSDLEFLIDGAGPFTVNNIVNTNGGNDNSTRVIRVGSLDGSSSNQEIRLASLVSNAGGATTTGNTASALYFDSNQGYRLTVTGATTLTRTLTDFRTRGALLTLEGPVGGAGALHKYEQGTLVLANANTYTGATNIYNGYVIAANDAAFGNTTSAITFNGTSFAQILASGTRTINRAITNSATGSTQTVGGLDAGAKTFGGAFTLTRGINVTAVPGGDVSFTGVMSGAGGVNMAGTGTVILNNSNTYTGPTTVANGTLVGRAQASGSPFGNNSIFTISNGSLRLENTTGVSNNTTTTGALNVNGGNATIVVDNGSSPNTTLTFGSLVRTSNATVVLRGATTDLGTAGNEKLAFTSAPAVAKGTIGTWAVIQSGGNAGHYAGVSGSNIATASYSSADLNSSGAADLVNLDVAGSTLSGNRAAYAFRTSASVLLGSNTLKLGDDPSGTVGQAGMILNNGADVTGGTVDIGTNALSIYTDDAAVSTLSSAISNFRNNANNTLTTRLVKFGPGTLEISSAASTYQGNIQVSQGTLSLTAPNVIPTFANANAVTGSTVIIQPGATVRLNGNNQEFGNFSGSVIVSPVLNTAGTLDLGGATLTFGRQGSSTSFSGQLVGGAGSRLVKIGGGRLTLDNWDASRPNSLETLEVLQGVVLSYHNDNSWATPNGFASSLPSTTQILLRGGEWEAYVVGDNTSNFQFIPMGQSITARDGNAVLDTNRWQGGAANKILGFDTLTVDKNLVTITGGNAIYPRFAGAFTMTANARLQTDAPLLLNGTINGYFTLNKTGGSNLEINADNSAWSGGTVLLDGTLLFGSRTPEVGERYMAGTNVFSYSATANLGTGDIIVNRSTAIRLNAPTNVLTAQGQRVQTFSNLQNAGLARVDIGLDAPLTDYGLRSTTNGALTVGLNDGFYTNSLDQSLMGNGRWAVSAWNTTFYTAAKLGYGIDNTYRFAGVNGVFNITQANALSGPATLEVGMDMTPNGFAINSGNAQVQLYGDQSYTGNTIIRRNRETGSTQNFLTIHADVASPVIDVYGRLMARGAGRFTNDAGAQVNTVNLYPGSVLRLDYNMDVNDSMLTSRLENSNLGLAATENKWGDSTPMLLDGATLNLLSSGGRVNREVVGAITVRNGAAVLLERNSTNGQIILETPSITRVGQATFAIRENADELGRVDLQSQKFFIDNGATMLDARGLLPVWMTNPSRNTFLTYNANLGIQNAAFTASTTTAAAGASFLGGLTSTSVASYGVGVGDATLTGPVNVYALRIAHEASGNDATLTGGQINIHSGGLIVDNRDNARVNFDTTAVYFGDGTTPVEAVVYSDQSNITTRFGGVVTAANFTMHGAGNVQFTNTANVITGNIQMNSGKLFLDGAGTAGNSNASITLAGDWLQNNDGQQMAELWLRTNNNANTTWNNSLVIAENVPYARIIGGRYTGTSTATATNTISGSLTIHGTNTLQGTTLIVGSTGTGSSENTHNLTINGATTLGGSAPIGIRVEQSGRVLQLTGAVTGSAPILKSGDGTLRLDGNNINLSSPVTLNRGEIRGIGNNTNNFFGTGDYTLNFGTLRLSAGGTIASQFNAPNQDLIFAGAVNFVNDRNGGAARTLTIGTNNGTNTLRTLNGAHWRMTSDSGDSVVFESKIFINDAAVFFTDNAPTWFRDTFEGAGRFTKVGVSQILFDNNVANSNWTGTIDIQAGYIRVQQPLQTLGGAGSSIIVNPAAGLSVHNVGSLGTGAGISQLRTTSRTSATILGGLSTTNFDALRTHYNGLTSIGTGVGVLTLNGTQNWSVADASFMANFRDGNWYLGTLHDTATLTMNSLLPWGPGGNKFLLGGGSSALVLNPATAGSAQLAGAGNQVIVGIPQTYFGYATVTFGANANNTYDGGTFVTRSRNLDGSYRGTAFSLQGGADGVTTNFRTPLGSGAVDVFGEIRIEGASGTAANGVNTNANTWTFHPGTRIRFDNGTPFTGSGTTGNYATGTLGGGGRWGDTVGMDLNATVLELYADDSDHIANREVIGDLTVARGSEVVIRRRGAFWAELDAGNLTRGSNGTLMITTMVTDTNTAGIIGTGTTNANATRFLIDNAAALTNQNMIDPWIVSRLDGQFLKYDATNGFQLITQGTSPANYVATSTTTLTAAVLGGVNDGTRILSLEGSSNFTLGANLDIHALRLERDINVSADGLFNKITIRSGGLTNFNTSNTPTINTDLYFGATGTSEALIHASSNTLQINGKIFASQVTKFGTAVLNIRSDQPQFSGNWVVNGGGIQFLTPGAPSSGEVILNGSRANDRDNTFNLSEVRYNFNSGSPDLFTWNGGKITGYDVNRIYMPTASDRLQQIPAVDLRTSNAVAGSGQEGLMIFLIDGARSTVRTGTVTLHDHYQVQVESNTYGTGSTVGFQFGAGDGTGGLNNQGLYNLSKTGDGVLTLGNNTASFTGGRSITIGEGAVRVLHAGAFGGAGNTANIEQGGALEIAVAGWSPSATLNMQPGAIERWAVNGARSGNHVLPSGVHLQIMANQTGTKTITLDGGSIMGYLPRDWDHVAIIHQLGSGITLNLASDSFLGQPYASSNNSLWDQARFYDIGKINQTNASNPNDMGLRGSYLQIHGNITGPGGLTKVGQDIILLNGANTYEGSTVVENGILQIGRNNSLPVGTDLRLETSSGMFDLNGFNQEVASLAGDQGSVNNGAFALNTLTVNQASASTYGGTLDGNVSLVKSNVGVLTLAGVSAMRGDLIINGGSVALTGSGAVSESRWISVGTGTSFDVTGRTGGAYTYDGLISGGGVGALRADNANRGRILGSISLSDNVGTHARTAALKPGGSSGGAYATAGDQVGHLQITGNLSLAGGLYGSSTKTERLTLQLAAPTSTLSALGWDGSSLAAWLTANAAPVLNGEQGDLSGHDYVNVGGAVTLNEHGTVGVALTNSYTPAFGDIFNLLDWTTITANTFNAGPARVGGGSGYDLNLPDLSAYQLGWNTDLFLSHGVLVVAPEPGRMLLVFLGLAGLCLRRRR